MKLKNGDSVKVLEDGPFGTSLKKNEVVVVEETAGMGTSVIVKTSKGKFYFLHSECVEKI